MALHFIYGDAGSGKSYRLYKKISDLAVENRKTNYMMIVPEQFTLQTQKDLVTLPEGRKGIMNIEVVSFLRLAWRVFEEVGGEDRIVLEDTGKIMLMKKVAMKHRGELQLFGRNVERYGFISELKSIISEFYQYGIGEEELIKMQEAAKGNAVLEKKLHDLTVLYRGFEEMLAERYITTEGILDMLCEKIPKSKVLRDSVICLDGFTGFTPSQYKLIEQLMRVAKDCYITVTMPEGELFQKKKEYELFFLSSQTAEAMQRLALKARQEDVFAECTEMKGRYAAEESLKFLSENLFRSHAVYKEKAEAIRLFAHQDIRSEVMWTVAEIYRLVKKEDYRYRDIAVVTADMDSYAEYMARELERAGLPYFIDQKKRILDNPMIEFIRAAINVAVYDFSYESVLHFAKSSLAGFVPEQVDAFENYALAVGVRGMSAYGKEWKRKLRTRYSVDYEVINEVRKSVLSKLIEFCAVMKKENTSGKERVQAIRTLLDTSDVKEKTEKMVEEFAANGEPLRAKEYEQIWEIVSDILERIEALIGEEEMCLAEFQEILETGFTEAKVGLVPPGIDQIVVGDMERTRLKDIKALFFVGLNDSVVPKQGKNGGVLSEPDRARIAGAGVELAPDRRQSAFYSEFYLYLSMTRPTKKLYLSYRKTDGSGKAMRPSYLIGRVKTYFNDLKEEQAMNLRPEEILSSDRGARWFLGELQNALNEPELASEEFKALYHLILEKKIMFPTKIENIAAAAFYRKPEQPLSKEEAMAVYKNTLYGSVSRLEKYAECAFAHFLTYGLHLEERQEFEIRMPDIGTLYHNALQYFSETVKAEALRWHDLTEEKSDEILEKSVERAAQELGQWMFESNARNGNLLRRIKKMLKRTVDTVKMQISVGDFEPEWFEKQFVHADKYLNLHGRIDRVDLCERNGITYLRVVDYKSGNNEFRVEKLCEGLQLQLAVYMKQALEMVKEERSIDVKPAAMMYYHIQDPIVEKAENVQSAINKALKLGGVINAAAEAIIGQDRIFEGQDGKLAGSAKSEAIKVETTKEGNLSQRSKNLVAEDKFQALLDYTTELMHQTSQEIIKGNVEPAPYRDKNTKSCQYCAYRGTCGFDTTLGYKERRTKNFTEDDCWNMILSKKEQE